MNLAGFSVRPCAAYSEAYRLFRKMELRHLGTASLRI
jgi:hypothetical protein